MENGTKWTRVIFGCLIIIIHAIGVPVVSIDS